MSDFKKKNEKHNKCMIVIRDTNIYNTFTAKFDQHIVLENGKKKSLYNPPTGWDKLKKDITTKQSKNVGVLTGKINNIIVVDLDMDKNNKKSGMEWFENNFGKIEDFNTLITKSISGGRHLYFKFSKEIKVGNGIIEGYNVDIKGDKGFMYEGTDYDLIKETDELMEPDFLIEYFKNKKTSGRF